MYASRDELEVLEYWGKKQIFKKLQEKNKGKKKFSFIDGPITANNPMGVHHAWGRTYKDLYQRFKAMQGYDQRYQNGFDCQGLWVEVEVEKDLNFNSKKDIERFGLEKFSNTCKERVNKFSKIQTEQSIRLGQWMDWDNSYYTMSDNNIEHIWYFLKKCKEMGWLYKGSKIMPWCIRCGSSSSKHEMSDGGYADLTHTSVYFLFKLKNKDEYLIIWSTTPWTFSSNVAAAINPELNYSQVRYNGKIYYLAESMLKRIIHDDYLVLDTIKGSNMIGWEYEAPYDDFDVQKDVNHKIIPWEEVGADIGTGIVHIAPGCGEEDFELGKKYGLPALSPLNEDGTFRDGYGWQTNRFVWDVNKQVLDDLKKKNAFFSIEQITHRYPICWRCKEELVFRMVSEWFISADQIRPMMLMNIKKVKWEPDYCQKLMEDWITNMEDWCISRKRYWGLPLMFYVCSCGEIIIIGSKKELRKLAIDPKKVDELPEFHRPWIDEIYIKCHQCKREIKRIPEVGDCWLDAGVVPYSTLNYLTDKRYWKAWFPANLVIEMRAQIRLWFYSLLFISTTLENKPPYREVFCYEEVRDENGDAMHKSKGNAIWFNEAAEKIGVDIMRLIYLQQNPRFNLCFGYNITEERKKTINNLLNLETYVSQFKEETQKKLNIEDKWILSRLNNLIIKITDDLEKLQPNQAIISLIDFFTIDFSKDYIKFIRDRVQNEIGENKETAIYILHKIYLTLLKLLAPFIPFTTEKIYLRVYNQKESVHLEDWPKSDKKLIKNELEGDMEYVLLVIESILAARNKAELGLRWPLGSVTISTKNIGIKKSIKKMNKLIKKQTNIKKIIVTEEIDISDKTSVEFKHGYIKLNTNLTKKLEVEGFSREITRKIQDIRKKQGMIRGDVIDLYIETNQKLIEKEISSKVNSRTIQISNKKPEQSFVVEENFKVKGKDFKIYFTKL
ncbi:isoleucine--tRNA ligase [Candidatus Woesearchaeota archaeon]|nr:isoleucine--tRNA ligase [Candidatus Woesearchaeota archaeon]